MLLFEYCFPSWTVLKFSLQRPQLERTSSSVFVTFIHTPGHYTRIRAWSLPSLFFRNGLPSRLVWDLEWMVETHDLSSRTYISTNVPLWLTPVRITAERIFILSPERNLGNNQTRCFVFHSAFPTYLRPFKTYTNWQDPLAQAFPTDVATCTPPNKGVTRLLSFVAPDTFRRTNPQ